MLPFLPSIRTYSVSTSVFNILLTVVPNLPTMSSAILSVILLLFSIYETTFSQSLLTKVI